MRSSLLLLAVVSLVAVGVAHPTKASGQVVHIVDGDTFDVLIEQSDRNLEDKIRVRLADIDCPETGGGACGVAGAMKLEAMFFRMERM